MMTLEYDLIGGYFMLTVEDNPKIAGDPGDISEKDIQRVRKFIVRHQHALLSVWNQDNNASHFTWNDWE